MLTGLREGDFSISPLRRGLDSAAVSWGVYMYQPGALPDPVLLPPEDWSCCGSWWWEGNLYQCQNPRVHLWILICLHWENFPFPVAYLHEIQTYAETLGEDLLAQPQVLSFTLCSFSSVPALPQLDGPAGFLIALWWLELYSSHESLVLGAFSLKWGS